MFYDPRELIVEPIELTARREALGFTIASLAKQLGIRENSVARWEGGTYEPKDWEWIDSALRVMEDYQDEATRRLVSQALEGQEGSTSRLVSYRSDDALWAADGVAARGRIPAVVHRSATARAASILRSTEGRSAVVVSGW